MTALELVIGVGVLASLGLVMIGLLRAGILSSGRLAERIFVLSAARKALGGSDGFDGIVWDARLAAEVRSLDPGKLALGAADGAPISYQLSPEGALVYSGPSPDGSASAAKAKGLAGLSFRYYERGADYRVLESTRAAGATLVTISLEVPAKARTVRLFTGARLMNRP